ncbi:MAG TPA: ROK family protein [Acidobacteriaceae bacterium]
MRSNSSGFADNTVLVGVDIGGTKTAVVLCAQAPDILWRKEFPTAPELGWQHAMEKIVALVREGLAETGSLPQRIGVSCGGPLDRVAGIIQQPPNLPTWNAVPVKAILEEEFGIRCSVENDANAGAVAEHQFGAGRGCRHMVFLTFGTGLGAGLVLNGHIFRGSNGMAGELGHVRLTMDGPSGHGKAGSVEGWASGAGMALHGADTVRAALAAGEKTALQNKLDQLSARDIGQAMAEGDAVAARIVHQTGERLGDALAVVVDMLNPERIVVGGLAIRLGEHLLGPARRRMHEEALAAAADVCFLVPARLGEQIGDVAAICVAMGLHDD